MSEAKGGSIVAGSLWMIGISLLLIWLPGIGGFLSGFVGGRAAGGVAGALVAWLLSSVLFVALFAAFGTMLSGLVVVGFIAGLGGLIIAFLDLGFRLLGAILGGLFA